VRTSSSWVKRHVMATAWLDQLKLAPPPYACYELFRTVRLKGFGAMLVGFRSSSRPEEMTRAIQNRSCLGACQNLLNASSQGEQQQHDVKLLEYDVMLVCLAHLPKHEGTGTVVS
jgi:hypothetical protein